MSIAAVTEAIDNFATNDETLRDTLLGQFDTELGEVEAERSKDNAALDAEIREIEARRARMNAKHDARREKIADRKVAINNEFEQRAIDLMAILNGKA
jgi:hypothetical protein